MKRAELVTPPRRAGSKGLFKLELWRDGGDDREISLVAEDIKIVEGRGGQVARSRLWGRMVPGSKLVSTEDPPRFGPVALQIVRRGSNVLTMVWCGYLKRGVPVQVSSSSSDCGSK
ncbi:hypothetical protein AVEN_185416-1 [Araneus ventricosus]|uniref:Uncharacterized protein n=1 Tax=Araneus ventricosus TaxID=182803 RepID=A0A4Y2CHM6_ARAVE|nr:hypothetical protein AVEN_185416-1 [Araneus ventricosus]